MTRPDDVRAAQEPVTEAGKRPVTTQGLGLSGAYRRWTRDDDFPGPDVDIDAWIVAIEAEAAASATARAEAAEAVVKAARELSTFLEDEMETFADEDFPGSVMSVATHDRLDTLSDTLTAALRAYQERVDG